MLPLSQPASGQAPSTTSTKANVGRAIPPPLPVLQPVWVGVLAVVVLFLGANIGMAAFAGAVVLAALAVNEGIALATEKRAAPASWKRGIGRPGSAA